MTKGTSSNPKEDLELQNTIGNLLICLYQEDRLKQRLIERVSQSHLPLPESLHIFRYGDNWYKVSLKVEKQSTQPRIKDTDE